MIKAHQLIHLFLKLSNKNILVNVAKIIIAAGLLYYLINSVDYNQIVLAIKNANLAIILLVILLGALNIYLQYSKWRLTCKEVLEVETKSKILRSLFYGFSAGIITPLRIGEYFGRGIEFKDKSLVQVTVATLVDKFFPIVNGCFSWFNFEFTFYLFRIMNVSIYIVLSLFVLIFTFFYLLIVLLMNKRFWNSILFSKINSSARAEVFYR